MKFINDESVDVYAFINEIHDFLGFPPFEPTNTTRMGVGFYGLIRDVVAVLPLEDWAALVDKILQTKESYKTLVTLIHPTELMVTIHCVYLIYVNCCLCYVHKSVWILVMNALLRPTGHGVCCANLARIPRTAQASTRKVCWCASYLWTP